MFFLESEDTEMETFRQRWDLLGEDVAIEGEDGLWNCHIHTDDIGGCIEAGIEAGRPRRIRIRDLYEEVGELEADLEAGAFSPLSSVLDAPIGVVAVTEGKGLVERFRQLGVQQIVPGGRAGGPSREDLLAAVDEAPANSLIVLPNDVGTVPIAEQLNALTTKTVAVVPTRSIAQGLAAMLGYVPGADDLDAQLEDMAVAAGAIEFGEVARATREASVDGWRVMSGDWLGIADGRVVVVDPDRFSTLRGLAAAILPTQAARLTVYTGAGSQRADIKALEAWVGETHPAVQVMAVDGGHKSLPYLVVVE